MKELAQRIKNGDVILFVGAGVSATVQLPTWEELIQHMADTLGYDSQIFSMYGDPLILAEYFRIQHGSLKSLTDWMKDNWHVSDDMIRNSAIYKSIVQLNFPIIYTTNFDLCLEQAYKEFKRDYIRISRVQDLCKCKEGKTQIVKLHGDLHNVHNIVLTESDYFDRLDFESSLDIKLRSDILGKSVLFIGYSLSDINMRFLLYKLNKLWGNGRKKSQPHSYIFMAIPNRIQEAVWKSRHLTPVIGQETDQTKSLERFLKELLLEIEAK